MERQAGFLRVPPHAIQGLTLGRLMGREVGREVGRGGWRFCQILPSWSSWLTLEDCEGRGVVFRTNFYP